VKIGTVHLRNNLIVAPMAGVTDRPFRSLCKRMGAGMAVSEMVASNSLLWGSEKTIRRGNHEGEVEPKVIQIAGAEPEMMAEAARYNVDKGADIIDINMGCPAKKICNVYAGSALLRDEPLVARIVDAVVRAVNVPVTLKIRTGWDEDSINCIEVAQMAEAAGVAMLTVHGRTRLQLYTGFADWDRIGEVKRSVEIPVVGCGDVVSIASARERWERSGADGLAIARGAMENPWLFQQIAGDLAGVAVREPTVVERFGALRRYRALLDELYPAKVTAARLRGMTCRTLKGFPGSAQLRESVTQTRTSEELLAVLDSFESASTARGFAEAAA